MAAAWHWWWQQRSRQRGSSVRSKGSTGAGGRGALNEVRREREEWVWAKMFVIDHV